MTFDLPTNQNSIIKVIGVGGGGSNAVNHMFRQGIKGVDFIVCNTDQQALDASPVPTRIALGASLTKGRGAGAIPEVGKNAAIENIEEIREILKNDTQMVFITAGMGGGPGTGAAPIIAQAAKEMGILTVGIITIPFGFEGKKRRELAEAGRQEMEKYVDTLIVIGNEKLREIYGNLKLSAAYAHADDVLTCAAKGIAEIITTPEKVNVDFADIKTVMTDSGVAIMGTGVASGEGRSIKAVEEAMHSPLLNNSNIEGARYVLLNIVCGQDEITMDELSEMTDLIQERAGGTAEIIKGYGIDESIESAVKVTLIATGFNRRQESNKKVFDLESKSSFSNEAGPIVHSLISPAPVVVHKLDLKSESKVEKPVEKINDKQVTIEFDVVNKIDAAQMNIEPSFEPTLIVKSESEMPSMEKIQEEEQMRKSRERMEKLREFNFKLRNSNGINELENEPAYKRRNVDMDQAPHSSESQVSRYSLNENDGKSIEINTNNSFLHDQAD